MCTVECGLLRPNIYKGLGSVFFLNELNYIDQKWENNYNDRKDFYFK